MSDWLLILYKPSTGHSLGAFFLFFWISKKCSSFVVFKLLDCRVWPHPSFHRRFDQLIVFRLTSNSIHTFYRTFPGDKCFVFLNFDFFSLVLKLWNLETSNVNLTHLSASGGLQILYRPSTQHSLGANFLFSQIHPNFSSYGVLKISDCRVWPSAHTLPSFRIDFKFYTHIL